jgi:hypothetical protein
LMRIQGRACNDFSGFLKGIFDLEQQGNACRDRPRRRPV